tara:strand:- start:840 stop:1205 length:366 start_codon:yes stop_codon:yes gene_type:complete
MFCSKIHIFFFLFEQQFLMDTFSRVHIEEAQQKLRSGNALFIDVRDYLSHIKGHIEPSFHINQNNINTLINQTPKDRPLVVYCYHGHSSQHAAQFLIEQGFSEVYNLEGGYEAWAFASEAP